MDKIYLRPLLSREEKSEGCTLAGGLLSFSEVEVIRRGMEGVESYRMGVEEVLRRSELEGDGCSGRVSDLMSCLTRPVDRRERLSFDVPRVMGILNVTPDSFSDGGEFLASERAIERGELLSEMGSDVLDIGGESTRPGALSVSCEEQCRRILPVIRHFTERGVCVSVDTRDAGVMRSALENGVALINDVSALGGDSESLEVVLERDCPVVLMHMQDIPERMQDNPLYEHVVLDIFDWLEERIRVCISRGIERSRLLVDPGIGFGKTLEHNLDILRHLSLFQGLGCPVMIGVSRKSFIGRMCCGEGVKDRLGGSISATLFALDQGVQLVRVHDVAETRQAITVWHTLHGDTE